jgi:tetratricopeptide (TPR) repeat protein
MSATRDLRRVPFACGLLALAVALALAGAAPPQIASTDDTLRRANDLFRAGDKDAADKLYEAAEGRAADPGLVAFNRGVVQFDRKQYREAELSFELVLRDAECPLLRAARAWYNRGTCLLWRGESIDVYGAAVASFERVLDSPAADEALKQRAADNLELAKLLWAEKRKEPANKNKSPNKDVPEERQPKPQPRTGLDSQPGKKDDGAPGTKENGPAPKTGSQPQPTPGSNENPTEVTAPGNNPNLPVLKDEAALQQLSEADARANLAGVARRIGREQKSLLRSLYGPDRPDVRDW